MKKYILRSESVFSPSAGGKALFVQEGQPPEQVDVIPAKIIDPGIPYEFLNPLQTLFWLAYEKGSCLVSAPTSAGKSLLAFLFFRVHGGRKVYTAPTKALVNEKADEFRKFYGKVDIRTGDSIEELKEVSAEVVVCTYESLVHALRNSAPWTQDIGALVIDEVHQIKKRWILEELISYVKMDGIPTLGLSATLPAVDDFARWMGVELLIKSEWRPVPLVRTTYVLKNFEPLSGIEKTLSDYKGTHLLSLVGKLWNAIWKLRKPDEKVIVFVPKKELGWLLLELADKSKVKVLNETVPFEKREDKEDQYKDLFQSVGLKLGQEDMIAFHNADIPSEERREIERAFREGKLNLLIATQTLAYGVNLPADRVIVLMRVFFDRDRGGFRCVPDELDILQMEGRAGRLGLKNKGWSDLLLYGGNEERVSEMIEKAMSEERLSTEITEKITDAEQILSGQFPEKKNKDLDMLSTLSLFILLGLVHAKDYMSFLEQTYSFGSIDKGLVRKVEEYLKAKEYIQGQGLTEKGWFCVRTGLPPIYLEEFLRRKHSHLPIYAVVRPLLHGKKLDGLEFFTKRGKSYDEDWSYAYSLVATGGNNLLADNTHQLVFYVEGLLFKYKNISHPPGEFSSLRTDALHLMRTLYELSKFGIAKFSPSEVLEISHCIKYGIVPEYSSIAGLKGVGHIRANLIKRTLHQEGRSAPPLLEKASVLEEMLSQDNIVDKMRELLTTERELSNKKAKEEIKKLSQLIKNNREGYLVDDKILFMFCYLYLGPSSIKLKKEDKVKAVKEMISFYLVE